MRRKTALITGAGRGIGRATALALSKEGYDVAINFRVHRKEAEEVRHLAEECDAKAVLLQADVGKTDELRRMYEELDGIFPELDLLVNNAGISPEAAFLDSTEELFDSMVSTDWKGLFFSSQYAAQRMITRGIKGVIINISSNQSEGCWPRASIYGPVKAAVSKFTKNAAMELAPFGIRMAAVAPGYTDTGWDPSDIRMRAAGRLLLKRFARPEEIARAVVYLASDDAAYITGSTLVIDGGATLPLAVANSLGLPDGPES